MKIESKKGITLLALVITIILMLILVGVVLYFTIGENGLINKAKLAGNAYQTAAEKEQKELDELYGYLGNENLPENTPETQAGTKVKRPDGWYTDTPNYTRETDGSVVTKSTRIATVDAISDGAGNTIPVPKGFYYVGGTLASGVVISDNSADQLIQENKKGKYWGVANVPSGISVSDSGEFSNEFQGNQFVWIPCESYEKHSWGQGDNQSNAYWDTTVDVAGRQQVQKYGGFYVGRYEAGLPQGTTEFTTSYDEDEYNNIAGVLQSKAGIVPWNFINWTNSRAKAQAMAKDLGYTSVNTELITGTQWDVMIQKIESVDSTKSITSSGAWGNYYSGITSFNYNGRYTTYDASNRLNAFSKEYVKEGTKNNSECVLLTTGASERNKGYNIYDVAGNLWEWTDETSYHGGNTATECRVYRGGGFGTSSSVHPACYRVGRGAVGHASPDIGFRVTLHIK